MLIIQGLLNTPSLVLYDSKNRLKTFERFALLHPRIPMWGAQLTALLPFYRMRRLLWWSLQHSCFPVEFAKFLRTPILKNNCKQLLLYCLSDGFHYHMFFLLRLKLKWLKIGGAKVYIVAYIFLRIITCLIKI